VKNRVWSIVAVTVGSGTVLLFTHVQAGEIGDVRARAERSYDQLKEHQDQTGSTKSFGVNRHSTEANSGAYSSDQYWIGKGQGDLAKGKVVCQRVSELSARTDLAKQIRVMVKEHMVDRVRERSGRETESDIELTREELVQEYLHGVKIVDRQIDEANKVCTATAVMLKTPMQPNRPTDADTAPSVTR
jgi:hypothetical protein